MKYKRGDKVRVRQDLVVAKRYNNVWFVSDMAQYMGKELTIKYVVGNRIYKVKEAGWSWSDDMFEPCNNININISTQDLLTFLEE